MGLSHVLFSRRARARGGASEAPPSHRPKRAVRHGSKLVLDTVVLVVYGWKSVEPGTLSWAFPSLTTAVRAAHAMTNAVQWAVIAGSSARATVDAAFDLAKLRALGGVLIEQTG